MAWTDISASTGVYTATSATTGSHGNPSRASTWLKFNTLRPLSTSSDVDFVYRASATNPVIANSVIPVCITDRSEQP